MRRLRMLLRTLPSNLYVGFLTLFLYPLLLLLLPSRIPERVAKFQGDLVYLFSPRSRRKLTATLRKKLGEGRSEQELKKIARDFFRIQSSYPYYSLFLAAFRLKWLDRFLEVEGLEHLEDSLKEGKGLVIASFHFNHPPVLAVFLGYLGIKAAGYAVHPWDLNVPVAMKINTWLCYRGSERKGACYAYRGRNAREIRERMFRENGVFGVLLDIALPGRQKNLLPVRFLGEEVLFPGGITQILYEQGCPVHAAYCLRDPEDWRRAKLVISPRIPVTGDAVRDMQAIVGANEEAVLKHPEQWWGWLKLDRIAAAVRKERDEGGLGGTEGEDVAA